MNKEEFIPNKSELIRSRPKDSYPNESSIRSQPKNSYPNESEPIQIQSEGSKTNETETIRGRRTFISDRIRDLLVKRFKKRKSKLEQGIKFAKKRLPA